ncbi:MAG: ATP-binding cassette domain-containing protein [Candidatus Pacebacteria bacterium]|nr:ATP-binding cassette domain-containing protein [Candidatus Paceibacterota bacterium]
MTKNESILRFGKVSFSYEEGIPLLSEVDFSVRRFSKITIMGQNGAGKSTIFNLITKKIKPDSGNINIANNLSIAISRQVIPRKELDLNVKEFFEKCFLEKVYDIEPKIKNVLEIVNLEAPMDKIVKSFSGGQQARLLLASALIQNPDLLLLDEPTNNLDKEGIEHLTKFLINYEKTCIVISHDAKFLNSFTDGVLYLDVFTKKIEQYTGNYLDVQEEIAIRQERDSRKNALIAKTAQLNYEKYNFFAHKGGKMRVVAKRMKEKAEIIKEQRVDIRREDKTIRPFVIEAQKDIGGLILGISKVKIIKKTKTSERSVKIEVRKNEHLLLKGPNGIGKSTLLESIVRNESDGIFVSPDIKIGYYRQDFSNLDFNNTVYKTLSLAAGEQEEQVLRNVAAGFLINNDLMSSKIEELSEGQKGLVSFACLVLEKPGLLILDEPTNHINFRHIPIIAEALNKYMGAMVIVSHVPEFIAKIRIDSVLDLEK